MRVPTSVFPQKSFLTSLPSSFFSNPTFGKFLDPLAAYIKTLQYNDKVFFPNSPFAHRLMMKTYLNQSFLPLKAHKDGYLEVFQKSDARTCFQMFAPSVNNAYIDPDENKEAVE